MSWFNNEDKKRIEILEQQIEILEEQMDFLTDEICKLTKALGKLEIKIDRDKYIKSDKDKEM